MRFAFFWTDASWRVPQLRCSHPTCLDIKVLLAQIHLAQSHNAFVLKISGAWHHVLRVAVQPRTAADQETSSLSIFDDPHGLSAESAEKTHWHSELSTFVTTHHETIGIKMDKSITRLEKANGTHCLFTVTPEQPFKWNPADATKTPFDVPGLFRLFPSGCL